MEFLETVKTIFLQIADVFANINLFPDVVDILLVAVLAYALITQLRKSQSIQVIKGIIFVVIVYGLVNLFDMTTSKFIFSRLFSDIIIIFVVLFSNELRHALENVGKRKFGKKYFFASSSSDEETIESINAVCRAAGAMSRSKVGSLIVFQRDSLLGDLTKHAVSIDSVTTFEMICSIFYPKAPLHDGAVVIKDGRIVAARCVVPMKNDRIISENVGTRHRAAIEVSLNSDAVVVVTSEETGLISLAIEGNLIRGLSDSELREKLGFYLLSPKSEKKGRLSRKNKATAAAEIATDSADVTESAVAAENFESTENVAEDNTADESLAELVADSAENAALENSDVDEAASDNSDVAIEAPFEEILSEEESGIINEGVENDEQE